MGTQRKGVVGLTGSDHNRKGFMNIKYFNKIVSKKSSYNIVFTALFQLSDEKMERKNEKASVFNVVAQHTEMMGELLCSRRKFWSPTKLMASRIKHIKST